MWGRSRCIVFDIEKTVGRYIMQIDNDIIERFGIGDPYSLQSCKCDILRNFIVYIISGIDEYSELE